MNEQTKSTQKSPYQTPKVERVGELSTVIRGTASPNKFDQITPNGCTPGDRKIDRAGRCAPI